MNRLERQALSMCLRMLIELTKQASWVYPDHQTDMQKMLHDIQEVSLDIAEQLETIPPTFEGN